MSQDLGRSSPDEDRHYFSGGGEMGRRVREHDWSATPLGPISTWPQSLRTAVRIMLGSRYAMWLGWGPDLTFLYNDAYAKMTLGSKHPGALGQGAYEVWPEIWSDLKPRIETVLQTGQATWDEGLLLFLERRGFPEETYHTFSYSPLPDDTGGIGGMLCVVTEDTERRLSERRLRTLRELTARTTDEGRSADLACQTAARILAANPFDVPFVLLYLLEERSLRVKLAGSSDLSPGTPASPAVIDLDREAGPWPFRQVIETGRSVQVDRLVERFGVLNVGAWPEPPERAVVLPIAKPGQSRPVGFVVAGISPRLEWNDHYRGFLDLLAGHIATAIANARAYGEERRRAEALAELDRAKTAFFSNISHEFRTPLTLMLGPLEDSLSNANEPLSESQRQRLDVVHRNAARLLRLVNTLLDFSRIEAGRLEATYLPTNLPALTRDLASNFHGACEKAGLELHVTCDAAMKPVYVDHDMWEKIVLNLLSNAFKFTFEGRIDVAVRSEAEHAVLEIRDTGVGIPAKEMPKLFDRFHRVQGTRGRTQEGSGIGLALVQELVRLHGGEVDVASEENVGTTVTVRVPFGTAHLPEDRVKHEPGHFGKRGLDPFVEEALRWLPEDSTAPLADGPAGVEADNVIPLSTGLVVDARPRIVLADDNADMRDYVRRLLSTEYDVTAVADGPSILKAVETDLPDLVLTDVMMPGLDGFAVLRALRADPRTQDMPVLLLSARAGEEARIEGLAAGADDYLTKPFSAKELLARVSTQLTLAKLRREAAEALRESESRFRNMADNAPVMIWMTNAKGSCIYLNRQWYDFTATTPDQVLGHGWLNLVHPDDLLATKSVFAEANDKREPFRLEYRLRHRDGGYHWGIDSAVPRFGASGEFLGFIGSVIDITDLKRVESELRAADRRKDEFLAMLAHELRNPLAPIRSGLELLAMEESDQQEVIELMQAQVEHLVRLVDDLLDVSRIMRGKIELRKEIVELSTLIKRSCAAVQAMIAAQDQQLVVSLPEQRLWLKADPVRLVQVIENLLNNASKYTDAGGRIELSVQQEQDDAVISVRDTGIGIEPELLPNVFELFTQSSRSLDRSQGGLGIGLTLVHRLVAMHGGEISADSPGVGQGSTFTVRLPISRRAGVPRPMGSPASDVPRRRILLVDDNLAAAKIFALLLEKLGDHGIEIVHDGPTALDRARETQPEVILLDIGLPGMDGFEIAEAIRRERRFDSVLLVALTGYGQAEDRRRSKAAGFDEHLVKPPSLDDVRSVLSHPKLRTPPSTANIPTGGTTR